MALLSYFMENRQKTKKKSKSPHSKSNGMGQDQQKGTTAKAGETPATALPPAEREEDAYAREAAKMHHVRTHADVVQTLPAYLLESNRLFAQLKELRSVPPLLPSTTDQSVLSIGKHGKLLEDHTNFVQKMFAPPALSPPAAAATASVAEGSSGPAVPPSSATKPTERSRSTTTVESLSASALSRLRSSTTVGAPSANVSAPTAPSLFFSDDVVRFFAIQQTMENREGQHALLREQQMAARSERVGYFAQQVRHRVRTQSHRSQQLMEMLSVGTLVEDVDRLHSLAAEVGELALEFDALLTDEQRRHVRESVELASINSST